MLLLGAEHMVVPNKFGVLLARKERTKEIRQPTGPVYVVIRIMNWFKKPT